MTTIEITHIRKSNGSEGEWIENKSTVLNKAELEKYRNSLEEMFNCKIDFYYKKRYNENTDE